MSAENQARIRNGFSVDVEDYFHTEAMAGAVARESWDTLPSRVEHNTHLIMEVLQRHKVRGTFFILGWIADRFPHLLQELACQGHELACHSYWHRPVYTLTHAEFKEDTLRSKCAIENAAGVRVRGYRAPTFSIVPATAWALEILAELGFLYDSSTHPIRHDLYANPYGQRHPFVTSTGSLLEFPITTLQLLSHNFPFSGGGYFRILPYAYTKRALRHINTQEHMAAIFYIHPWEFDPEQPRFRTSVKSRIRQYTGLRATAPKLERLVRDFRFVPLGTLFDERMKSSDTPSAVDLGRCTVTESLGER